MRRVLIIILVSFSLALQAQNAPDDLLRKSLAGYTGYSWKTSERDTILWGAQLKAVASSGEYAPYHLWANREYTSPMPYNGSISVQAEKKYTNPKRWMDYSFNIEPVLSIDRNDTGVWLREGYVAARLYVFELTAGMRYSDNYGYYETSSLSSGGLLFSHNAMAIPRITVSTNGYVPFPFLFGYLEVKGGLTHGWLGPTGYVQNAFMHHKYIGGRIGGKLPVNISYEFHHAAQWGGTHPSYGELGSSFRDFINTFFARSGGVMPNDQINAQGNHLGSQVIGLDFKLGKWKASAYWQSIFEDGPIYIPWNAQNSRDGLWGISISNSSFPYISEILYEFFNTTNQAGSFHDRDGVIYGGGDSYYTNGIYRNGWTYRGYTIGHPLIISPMALPEGSISPKVTRMRSHHAGIRGDIKGFEYRMMASYTRLYDRYEYPTDNYNHAFLLEVNKNFKSIWNLDFGISLAMDRGTQFGNSFGIMFTIARKGLLWGQK